MTDRIIVLFAILICIGTALFLYKGLIAPKYSDVDAETPIDYALEPFQEADPDTHIPALKHSGSSYNLTPKAKYQISGILVSKRRYRRGYMSWLSPYDYAIIWGKAPDICLT